MNRLITLFKFWMSFEVEKAMMKEILLKLQSCKVCSFFCNNTALLPIIFLYISDPVYTCMYSQCFFY